MRKLALILLVILILGTVALEAQTTGRLAVRVRDNSGKALEFVNIVVLRGTQRITGGQTNERGTAIIINIPPGTYSVKFSLVGYDETTYQDVKIQVDAATNLTPSLRKVGTVLNTTVVTAQTEAVDKAQVGSKRTIDVEKMSDVAVSDVAGIISLQAGVTNIGGELHIRGGRSNEVNYTIDGMSVSDPVDGGSALQVDTDAISAMNVMTGGFSAEFGNAQSGVVNIVTRDGDPSYSGRIEYQTDHLIGDGRNSDVIKFSFGGPMLGYAFGDLRERFTFFINGGGEWLDGRLKDYYVGNPNQDFVLNGVQLLEYEYPGYDPYAGRENIGGVDTGNRNYNSYNVNFKSKYVVSPQQRITFAVRGDRSLNLPFGYNWRYALQHYAYDETVQRQYIATYDYVFNPVMNLKLKASYYQKNSTSGPRGIDRNGYIKMVVDPNNPGADYIDNVLYGDYGYASVDNDNDGVYDDGFLGSSFWTYRIQGVELPRNVTGFNAPGTIFSNFVDDKTTTISGRADFEWQVNDIHLAKTGLEVINYNIEKDQLQSFLTIYEDRFQAYLKDIYDMADYDTTSTVVPSALYSVEDDGEGTYIPIYKPVDYYNAALASSGKRDGYQANPWQAAYYLQDKMEWEGMIVNAGLRFDFWYLGKSYKVAQDNGTDNTVTFDKSDRTQMMISPRLGVSHPITERDVLRFAYNYQNQLPQMQFIFTSKTPEDANISDQVITVGNPTLEPQITVTYEVGLSHQISDDYVLDMTAYYKNLYNYVSTKKVKKPGEEQISWYEFISEDYGSTRGLDVQLEKLLSDFNSWSIAYSLAWAQGNNSSTVIQDEATNLREFPLDWDVRHNLSFNYTFRISKGEEYFIPFTDFILPLDDFSANMTWSMASGSPYTPQSLVGSSELDTNSKRKDFTQQANMRITKGVSLPGKMKVKVFFDIENLFKTKNILSVYPKTGLPDDSGADIAESDTGYIYEERRFLTRMAESNPGNYNNFRSVTLGLSVNF
ncbi:MAG: hypothetical protein CVU48_05290 [Candidatus Cloacimonetes bacterium HGW-Cloacimonetes-1]|nr:MAG: hypothetical protein CVU48_05290 [Candidatus Cloacimonetes bacterium HGW-Cloacimonetes-1]